MSRRIVLVVALVVGAALVPRPAGADGTPANDVAIEIQKIAARIREIRANPSFDQDQKLAEVIGEIAALDQQLVRLREARQRLEGGFLQVVQIVI